MTNQKPKILIIDDTPANLMTLGAALAQDFDLQIAISGAAGLVQARETRPELILLDVMMPEMDGFETCQRFKADALLRSIPVIFVTALHDPESEERGLALGAADYITKPINVGIARQRICNLLEREQLRHQIEIQRDLLKAEVTERRFTQLALQESLSRQQKIASRVPGVIYQYRLRPDGSSCFPYASEAIHDIYRVSPDEVREDASKLLAVLHPEDLDAVVDSIQQSAMNLTPWQHEYRVRFNDGTVRWLYGNAVPEREFNGAVLWNGFTTDITERRQTDETLRNLSIVVEQSPASIVITDRHANIEYVNPQFAKTSGYGLDEVIGKNPQILKSELTPSATYSQLWEHLSAGQAWHGQLINQRKNGENYWEECHISPVKNNAGMVTNYVAIKTDITGRIRDAEKIDHLMREQQAILNNGLISIVTVRNRKIIWANPAFEQMLGYASGELAGASTRQNYLSDEEFQRFGLEAYSTLAAGNAYRTQLEHVRKDGRLIWVDMSGTMLNQVTGESLWGFIDITQRMQAEIELMKSEAKIKSVLDNAADAMIMADQTGHHQYVNDATCLLLGYSRDELLQMNIEHITPAEELPAVLRQFKQLLSSGSLRTEFHLKRKDGTAIPVDFNGTMLPGGNALGSCRDISERKRLEKTLIESELHLKTILDNEPECITVVDEQGRLLQINPAGLAMMEADSQEQVIGRPVLELIAPEHREVFADLHARIVAGEAVHVEFEVVGFKGRRRWLESHTVLMQEHGQTVHLAVTRDITDRKLMEDQVRQLAFYDGLTGLANRKLFNDRLGQAMLAGKRNGRYGALLFLDLDNFKPLNDTHGHEAGDLLLIEVASRMKACVREMDTVARFGGDEFIVLLTKLTPDRVTSTQEAVRVAEKIRDALASPYVLHIPSDGDVAAITAEHHCSASIGIAMFIGQDATADNVLRRADLAMYNAKEHGRNQIWSSDTDQNESRF